MTSRSTLVSLVVSAIVAGASPLSHAEPPIWESRIGNPQGLTDDSTIELTFGSLEFSFPFFGHTYEGAEVLSISSNGFVSIGGSNGAGCCDGTGFFLTHSIYGRVTPLWTDLNPGIIGDVYVNAFADLGGLRNDRVVITWDTIFFDTNQPVRTQLQLMSNGVIVFGYDGVHTAGNLEEEVVGIAAADDNVDPLVVPDFSQDLPIDAPEHYAILQQFREYQPSFLPFDLDQTNIVFTPMPRGGYRVTNQRCTPTWWSTVYGTPLHLTDDSTSEVTFGSLGFSFPFANGIYRGAQMLSISSNGFVTLGGTSGNGCCIGTASDLVNGPYARIAPLWVDLTPDPITGDVYVSTPIQNGTDAVVITWDMVFYDTRRSSTFQLQLHGDGTMIFGYLCL
ncbi:MAG: hypothetical protein HYR85_23975, partial [Planctomycetes bacterium]|nr:hypothetical protein [Planctomycetota bacterium]